MAKPWSAVASSDGFKSLSPEQQDGARRQYFDEVVAPRVPVEHQELAWDQFSTDTGVGKRSLPVGIAPSTAGAGRGSGFTAPDAEPAYDIMTGAQIGEQPVMETRSIDSRRTRSAGRITDKDIPPMSLGSVVRDVGAGVAQIIPTVAKDVGEISRLATGDRIGKGLSDYADSSMDAARNIIGSERGAAQRRMLDQDMADPALGAGDVVMGNPGALADKIIPTIGSMALPIGVAGLAGRLASTGRAAELAAAIHPATVAARANAAREAAAIGTTMAQNAGDTYGTVRDAGGSQLGAYQGAGIAAVATGIAGKLTGGGAEAQAAKLLARDARGSIAAIPKAMLKEGGQEVGEEMGQYGGETVGTGGQFDANTAAKRAAVAGTLGAVMGGGVEGAGAIRESRIKQLRDSGEDAAADLMQKKHEFATVAESIDGELQRMPGNPEFQANYRQMRTAGIKPVEAAARSAVTTSYQRIAEMAGMSEKATSAALAKAADMPLDKVPEFFTKFTNHLAKNGLAQPFDGMADMATGLHAARDDAMEAAIGAVYQPNAEIQKTMNEVVALEHSNVANGIADVPINQELEAAAHTAATSPLNDIPEPTAAQKEAGNYQKGHIKLHGLDITIENPRGSERSGTSPDGTAWSNTMHAHYGYFKGTVGNDKDHVDTFIGPNPDSTKVFVVDQVNKDGSFDEHKVMLGFNSVEQADKNYHANYMPGWNGRAAITEMPIDQFKAWVKDGIKNAPLALPEAADTALPATPPQKETITNVPQPEQTAEETSPAPGPQDAAQASTDTASVNQIQGKEVSRFNGIYGKGMGLHAAKLEAERLNKAGDGRVQYHAEEHDDPTLTNPWAVVGRKPAPPPAQVSAAQNNPADAGFVVSGAGEKAKQASKAIKSAAKTKAKKQVAMFSRSTPQTETPAFKAWFGDSKVVDADGKPLVVYHGTAGNFSEFSKEKLGSFTGAPSARMGHFFAANPNVASGYAESHIDDMDSKEWNEHYKKVVAIKKRLSEAEKELESYGDSYYFSFAEKEERVILKQKERNAGRNSVAEAMEEFDEATRRFEELKTRNGANVLPVYLSIQNPYIHDFKGEKYRDERYSEIIAKAKAQGNDGVILRNTFDGNKVLNNDMTDILVVFENSQIKSAIGNSGQFDPQNPDIRLSRKPSSTEGLTVRQAQTIVNDLTAKWNNAPTVRVVESYTDLPIDAPSDVRGLYMRGTVWIVAGAHANADQVARTYAHETVAHHGLREMLGREDWRKLMRQIQTAIGMGNKPIGEISKYIRKTYVDENGRFNLNEAQESDEIAARVVENAVDPVTGHFRPGFGFVREAYAKVARWLREVVGIDVPFTMTELHGMLVAAQKNLQVGTRTAGGGQMVAAAAREDGQAARGKNGAVTNPNDVVGNQGGRSADDTTPGVRADKTLPAQGIRPLNRVEDKPKFEALIDSMKLNGWIGRPVLVWEHDGIVQALTGSHLIAAARKANIDVPVILVNKESAKWDDPNGLFSTFQDAINDQRQEIFLRAAGDKRAADLMDAEDRDPNWRNKPNEPTAPNSFGAPMFARGKPSSWSAPDPTRMDKIIYELQDGRVDLKRVQQSIEKSGQQIAEQFDARLAETLYPGRVAYRSQTFLESEAKPLLEAMARNNVPTDELADYLHARGAEERNKQVAKVNPKLPDGGAGTNTKGELMTNQNARAYLATVRPARKIVLDMLAKKVDAITEGTRTMLVGEGLEKQETIDAWTAAYKNYVPMFRDEAETGMPPHPQGAGFSVKGGASKRATGSTKEVTNILAHVLMQREAAITRAEKNRVALSLYGQALSHPNPDFWTTIKPSMKPAQIEAELQAMGVNPAAIHGMDSVPTIRSVSAVTGKVIDSPNPMYKNLPGAIPLRINGEDRVLMLNVDSERGQRLAESLKNLDGLTKLDIAGSVVGKTTRWLAAVNTQYNPAFGFVNLVRDTLGGAVNLGSTELRGNTLKVLANTTMAMQGIARELAHGGQTGKWQTLYRQFQQDGGQTGFKENFRDPNERAKAVEKELAALQKSGKLQPGAMAHAALDLLDGFNTTLENAVRLSAYSAALDQGMSRAKAARLGRELTVDFNRKGRLGREVGPLYAFFNASVQGSARTVAVLKGPTGAKVIAGGLALGAVQALMLLAAGYDDDEVPEFVKARALVIPLNWAGAGEKRHILIPLPPGLNVLPSTGRVLTELTLNGGKDLGKRSADAIGEIAGAFNPLGGGNIFTMDGALRTMAPTVVDPLIELGFNKNFSGNPIERQGYGGEKDNRPGVARTKESTQRSFTGQAYMGISKAINSMTGGDEFQAGVLSPTPERVRYIAQTVGGGVLRELEKTINASVLSAHGEEVKSSAIPVKGRFYGEVDDDQVQSSRYHEMGKKLGKLENSLKAMEAAGAFDAADKLENDNPEMELIRLYNHTQRTMAKLNKEAVQTISNPQNMKEIDRDRVDLMRDFNASVLEIEVKRGLTLAQKLRKSMGLANHE